VPSKLFAEPVEVPAPEGVRVPCEWSEGRIAWASESSLPAWASGADLVFALQA
jgi:hypothetical protein